MENRETLLVENGLLFKKDANTCGQELKLLVVPPDFSMELVKMIHEMFAHQSPWRTERIISKNYWIFDLKKINRTFVCVHCDLSLAPKLRRARNLSSLCSDIGKEAHVDTIDLTLSQGFRYVCLMVDVGSSYVMAQPMMRKDAKSLTKAIFDIFHLAAYFPILLIHDEGSEYRNAMLQNKLQNANIKTETFHHYDKNTNMAEANLSRLTNLFRKSLKNKDTWSQHLNKAVFCLNVSQKRYLKGSAIYTPSYLFNKRQLQIISPEDNDEFEASQTIKKLNKERFLDTITILEAVDKRKSLEPNELLLVHRKFVIASLKIKNKSRVHKLREYWTICRLVEHISDRLLLVRLQTGEERKVHVREVRKIRQDLYEQYKKLWEEASSE